MAREIEAQHFFFHVELLFFVERRNVGQVVRGVGDLLFFVQRVEQPFLSTAAIGRRRRARLQRPIEHRHQLRPMSAEAIKAAGFDERFDRRSIARLRIDPFAKIEQTRKRPMLVSLGDNRFGGAAAACLDRTQAEVNLPVGDFEVRIRRDSRRAARLRFPSAGSLRDARPARPCS